MAAKIRRKKIQFFIAIYEHTSSIYIEYSERRLKCIALKSARLYIGIEKSFEELIFY